VKCWLDANLDPGLALWLGSRYGVFVNHVRELALQRVSDRELFEAARRLGVTVIATKDTDFIELVKLLGPPPQILRLACGNLGAIPLRAMLDREFPDALKKLQDGDPWVEIG
jgi:predicted nuclease of predicted toxin-antitoxin system